MRSFAQVDVFTDEPYRGNPVAVVLEAEGLSTDEMQRFANWTNLSETTFVLPPTKPSADYLVRIFTPDVELPFAGHPTIGTCHAWLEAGGRPQVDGRPVQQCAGGLIALRHDQGRLAFAAPPLLRSGSVGEDDLAKVCRVLRIDRSNILDAQWADNGPGWVAVLLADAAAVLALDPDFSAADSYDIGVVGLHPVGVTETDDSASGAAIEVRAFFRSGGQPAEDPVTGSLNASIAQWLLADGRLTAPYVAAQGTAIGRSGRVFIDEADGEVWVGGHAVTCVHGSINL